MTERAYIFGQIALAVVFACLFAVPHVFNAMREDPHLVRIMTTDDGHYHARVKAALLHRFSEVRNGVTFGYPPARSAPPALVEYIVGTAFFWTHLKAPEVMIIMTVFVTPLIVFILAALLRGMGMSYAVTLLGTAAYLFAFASPLQKPVNMSLSLPITILSLLLLQRAWKNHDRISVISAGIILGVLPVVYFWSWAFVWCIGGWLLLLQYYYGASDTSKRLQIHALMMTAGIALIVSTPYAIELLSSSLGRDAVFSETAYRSTVIHTRTVESIPRTMLFALSILCMIAAVIRMPRPRNSEWIFPLAVGLGGFSAMYQNVIHGVRISFSSHFYPFVCLAVVILGLFAWQHLRRGCLRMLIISVAFLFLIATYWDYRMMPDIVLGRYYVRDIQHLKPALAIVDDGHREIILTDKVSAHMVTSWTDDDVVFTAYVKHLFISDREYAERYCLSEMFALSGPDYEWLGSEVTERKEQELIHDRADAFEQYCKPVLMDPQAALRTYEVSRVLWNERLRPDWKIDPLLFSLEEQGDGWSLWKRKEEMNI